MKKYIYLLIMALIAISCKETDELQNAPTDTPRVLNAKITKTESRAVWYAEPLSWDGADMANSRTYAKPEGEGPDFYNQYWSVGDAISYFNTTHNSMYISSKTDTIKDEYTTYFEEVSTGSGEALNTPYYYGVYPYKEDTKIATDGTVTFTFPENQEYCVDSYANGANGMIARHQSEDEVLEFLNFCSYLQLQLKTDDQTIASKDIDKIILKANNAQDLMSGVGTIAFVDSFPVVTMDHEKSINHLILDCRNQEIRLDSINATKFWFVLPGGFTFTKGFNITVSFTDGTYFKKSTNSTIGTITIERNHIKPLATLPLDEQNLLKSMIRYKYHTNTNPGKESFTFQEGLTYFRDEDGKPLTPHTFYNKTTGEYEITFDGHLYIIESNTFDNTKANAPIMDYIIVENSTAITLNDHAFWNCSADSIAINNDITSINYQAFGNIKAEYITINGDIHSIKKQAFYPPLSIEQWGKTTVTINGSIENLEEQGFFNAMSIGNLYVLERVTTIGPQAFSACMMLGNVSLPYVEHIEDGAFQSCSSLIKIDLHGVHKIGSSAFMACYALTEVCISRDCNEIGEGAFAGLANLQNVYLYASTPPTLAHDNPLDPYVFDLTTTIHIPQGSMEKYAADENWKYYINRRQVVADITPEQIEEHFGENAHESHNE